MKIAHLELRKIITAITLVLIGLSVMLPAYLGGIPLGADLDSHFRFVQPFYDEIAAGNFFPGWLAESNNGFGDPRFRFYPPLLYYLLVAGRFLTGDWYTAALAVFSILSIIGCVGVYAWARQSFSEKTGLIAAGVFAILPYHFTQFYQASLLAEFAATSFLPFAFLFVQRIAEDRKTPLGSVFGLAVSFALIVLTHIPVTIVGSLALGVFALLCTDWRHRKLSLVFSAIGVGIGLLLSSFFWFTMLTELSWIKAGHLMASEHYDYRNNFLFSPFSLTNLNTYLGSIIAALTIAILLPAITLTPRFFRRTEKPESIFETIGLRLPAFPAFRASLVVAFFSLFMTTDLSRPVWAVVPNLAGVQFPFRWLAVTSVVICPAVAASFVWLSKKVSAKQIRPWRLAVFAIAFVASGYSIYEFAISSDFLAKAAFTERIEASRAAPSFPLWLPNGAAEIKDVHPMNGPIDAGSREVIAAIVGTHRRRFTLAAGEAMEVRIRAYYYPLWQATVTTASGTRPAPTKKAEDGTLLVTVPPESCDLTVEFVD